MENFHKEYKKCVATVLLFAETFSKDDSNILCKEQKKKDFKAADLMFKMYPSKRKLAMNEQTGKYLPKHKC